jgi:hypothetical protein
VRRPPASWTAIGSSAGHPRRPNREAQRRFWVPRRARPEPGAGAFPPSRGVMGPKSRAGPWKPQMPVLQWLRENRPAHYSDRR